MATPQIKTLEINIQQVSLVGQTILCDIYLYGKKFCVGIQNPMFPIPLGRYRAYPYLGKHKYTRLVLWDVKGHEGIEVHEANYSNQLKGCTAVGTKIIDECLFHSVATLEALLKEVYKYNVCFVTLSRSSAFVENKGRV